MDWTQRFEEAMNTVLSSVPKPDIYYTKVRKIDDADTKLSLLTLMINNGPVRLFKSNRENVFECLLNDKSINNNTFSLFRYQDSKKAHKMFTSVTEKVPLLYRSSSKCTTTEKLQAICDCLREHPDWSVAHVGVFVSAAGCFKDPEIFKHVNSQSCDLGKSPFHLAVEAKNIHILRELMLTYALTDIPDNNGDNVYHYAARLQTDSDSITTYLLKYSKNGINHVNHERETPLLVACKQGNFYSSEVLLTNDAVVDVADDLGYPIHHLLKNKQLRTTEAIFQANPNQGHVRDNKYGGTPLHWAKEQKYIDLILKHDCDINAVSKSGDTALHIMVRRLRFPCLMALLCAGADANIKAVNGDSPLHTAVKACSIDMVYALIVFGADINAVNNSGETARHLAAGQSFNPLFKSGELICILHTAGAQRCLSTMKDCSKGCIRTGTYNGKEPEKLDIFENKCQDVFEKYIDIFIQKMQQEKCSDDTDCAKEERSKDTVLCLDGGGIRGLVLVQILMAIEKVAGRPIRELFDWIVGTSTGGILALALAKGTLDSPQGCFSSRPCKAIKVHKIVYYVHSIPRQEPNWYF